MFDLQGHRGARGLFPENTLEGFRAALALGATSFELDVAITKDAVPVVHHDPALNPDIARGPDGSHLLGRGPLIRDLTLEDLAAYDVGRLRPDSFYAARYPGQTPIDGARIPTLLDVLRLEGVRHFNLELKLMPDHPDWTVPPAQMVDLVLAAIDAAGVAPRVTIQSFDWRAPRAARRRRPDLAIGWLTEPATIKAAPLWRDDPAAPTTIVRVPDSIAAEGGGTWTPSHADLTPKLLESAHCLGLRVIPWTVNDPPDMRRLIAWGVDGLITDRPDQALPLLPP